MVAWGNENADPSINTLYLQISFSMTKITTFGFFSSIAYYLLNVVKMIMDDDHECECVYI